MCKFFRKCNRPCKSYRSHFIHWKHINKYCKDKDPNFEHYNTFTLLNKYERYDNRNIVIFRNSPLINYEKYKEYKIKSEITNILNEMIDKICYT